MMNKIQELSLVGFHKAMKETLFDTPRHAFSLKEQVSSPVVDINRTGTRENEKPSVS